MTATIIRLAAARHLADHGWRQHQRGGPGNPCCLVGAIDVAGVGRRYLDAVDARREVVSHLGYRVGTDSANAALLIDWNDHPRRTAEQVIAALRGEPIPDRSSP